LVLLEYLGNVSVTKAAAHLRITRVTFRECLTARPGFRRPWRFASLPL
jgi:hypothetical protein